MTEAEWLASSDLNAMLECLGDRVSARKLRLFACACCRRIWPLLPDEQSRQAIETAERFADGLATKEELRAAREAAARAPESAAAQVAARDARWAATWAAAGASRIAAWAVAKNSERQEQPGLLREIVGNPFQEPAPPGPLTPEVTRLAQALYEGHGDHFALCDALADAGAADLAEHFGTPDHPRGCWALDLLLGKQ